MTLSCRVVTLRSQLVPCCLVRDGNEWVGLQELSQSRLPVLSCLPGQEAAARGCISIHSLEHQVHIWRSSLDSGLFT